MIQCWLSRQSFMWKLDAHRMMYCRTFTIMKNMECFFQYVVRVIKQEWFYTIYQMKVLKQLWNQIWVVHWSRILQLLLIKVKILYHMKQSLWILRKSQEKWLYVVISELLMAAKRERRKIHFRFLIH